MTRLRLGAIFSLRRLFVTHFLHSSRENRFHFNIYYPYKFCLRIQYIPIVWPYLRPGTYWEHIITDKNKLIIYYQFTVVAQQKFEPRETLMIVLGLSLGVYWKYLITSLLKRMMDFLKILWLTVFNNVI